MAAPPHGPTYLARPDDEGPGWLVVARRDDGSEEIIEFGHPRARAERIAASMNR